MSRFSAHMDDEFTIQSLRNNAKKVNNCSRKISEKEMTKTYDYYLELCNRVPAYFQKKLSTMPNNKGYIWKGMHLYGYLPAENNDTTTMFEKIGENITRIHIWDQDTYKIYEKEDGQTKVLISEKIRKKLN